MRTRIPAVSLATVAMFLATAGPLMAQGQGTVSGRAIEALSQRPLVGVQVIIVGTTLGNLSGADGRYTITNVPAGARTVQAQIIGYKTVDHAVTVQAGETVQANFALEQTAIALDELVITGAGIATQKRKLGNTVATINTATMENAPVKTLSEMLTAREPGVVSLTTGGFAGEGARIRIRGSASLSQLNQPIIYVDGVRVTNGGGFAPGSDNQGGGGEPSRLDDINPQAIERVEILKGAAAATLYGTEASSGVIQIFTKKGSQGAPRYELSVEQAFSRFPADAYEPHAGFARSETQRVTSAAGLTVRSAQELSQHWGMQIRPFEVFEVPTIQQLYETGHATTTSLAVSGGTPLLTYFISGRISDENGPFGASYFGPVQDLDETRQANVNLTVYPIERLKVRINSMYTERYHEVPENNNNIYGTISAAINSKPELAHCDGSQRDTNSSVIGLCTGVGNAWGNGSFITVREAMQSINNDEVRRFAGSMGATYDIMGINLDATFGVDVLNQRGTSLLPFRYNVDNYTGNLVTGFRGVGDLDNRELTGDFKASWSATPNETWSFQTVLGGQGFFSERKSSGGTGNSFPAPGVEVLTSTADRIGFESFVSTAQIGLFGQEQIGFRDYAFFTVGGRYDKHSAFGETAGGVFYPKASISVVPSDVFDWGERMVSSLRVRAAVGQSGRQPSAFDKFTTYTARASETGAGIGPQNLGSQDLKPEVSTEFELGAEVGLFNDRIGVEATYWDRTISDALVERQFPVSGGWTQRQLDNIGEVKAHGWEVNARGLVFSTPNVQLNLFANASFLYQKVTDMGGAPPLKAGGAYPRYRNYIREGYAPGAFFGPVLREVGAGEYAFDQNNDCLPDTEAQALAYFSQPRDPTVINTLVAVGDPRAACKAQFPGDFLASYLGKPTPDWTGAFGTELSILHNIKLNTLFEFRAGNYFVHDLTTAFRRSHPTIGRNTREAAEVDAILLNPASTAQERVAAADKWVNELAALSPYDGLNEIFKGDFIRFRELSLSYVVPAAFVQRMGADAVTITAAGRNLKLWTSYPGADPEINVIGVARAGSVDANFLDGTNGWGAPIPRRYSVSARVTF